ncbi:hypothetical protein ADU90_05065 [Clostridium botulinum]|uniref:Cell division protein FtsL n=1 Tax=Clostridium botulinum C/D str. DC5 TaxID=1443128 RepID=A0A0A0IMM3_CLOBO|nr:hypothetical protein [Clostridium botulinum]KGN01884.1 hypothetical protein Z955_00350 [Clostridium botulinum C/D str. DC5]KOC55668.1 hypothetical protein ADU89_04940 [Clostridium botulinum]KOC57575.1 hypothetical protein ADU90_05065 [Clostridium botulinum]MCD3232785.1 hypothetical protein [Clostridium botulinum D/C]MCD3238647.1 hypothetical protein [Clostridium botulinum D/C]
MIVTNKNNIGISGNNALSPQEIPLKSGEKARKEDLQKLKKQNANKNKHKNMKRKAGVLRMIILCFAVAVVLVYRYSLIYNMEKNISEVKKDISSVAAENENLKIGLLKYDNIKVIEDKASKELNMIPKSSTNVQYINLNKKNFKDVSKVEKKEKNNIFKKIKEILF